MDSPDGRAWRPPFEQSPRHRVDSGISQEAQLSGSRLLRRNTIEKSTSTHHRVILTLLLTRRSQAAYYSIKMDEPCEITITNQDDIESANFTCSNGGPYGPYPPNIFIRDATGVLNFTQLESASGIFVTDSPQLLELYFPQLKSVEALNTTGSAALTGLYLPQMSSPSIDIDPHGDSYSLGSAYIIITGSPDLVNFDIPDTIGLSQLTLHGTPDWKISNLDSVYELESDACLSLPALETAGSLHLIGGDGSTSCFTLEKLKAVTQFNLTGIQPSEILFGTTPMTIGQMLTIESSVPNGYNDYEWLPTIAAGPIEKVDGSVLVRSNANVQIDFDSLSQVNVNLSITDNRNCTFKLNHLTDVGNLEVKDNSNTTLPSFPSLQRAESIHLRGHIKDINLFPELTHVANKVTVEASNDDFNCSDLLARSKGLTNEDLICSGGRDNVSGTTNGTPSSSPSSPPTSSTHSNLSPGAKAGIGVASAVVALCAAAVIVWFILRLRLRRKALSEGSPLQIEKIDDSGGQSSGIQENSGDDATREVEGSALPHQLEGQMVIQENPGSEIHELPATDRKPCRILPAHRGRVEGAALEHNE
ncbi:hypothetical protein GGS20DRAFT_599900 [Poronia punctata]|nr:hypothetical protein GGS20DRAFT_599900 [Poronia punctata]